MHDERGEPLGSVLLFTCDGLLSSLEVCTYGDPQPMPAPQRLDLPGAPCPCCGCRTLTERGAYDICPVCGWEDDGQDDADADVVRGGPNGRLSLAAARRAFRRQQHVPGAEGR